MTTQSQENLLRPFEGRDLWTIRLALQDRINYCKQRMVWPSKEDPPPRNPYWYWSQEKKQAQETLARLKEYMQGCHDWQRWKEI